MGPRGFRRRGRRRGLIVGAAVGTAVGRSTARNSNQAASDQPEQAAPVATSTSDQFAELEQLGKLKDQGILTQAEFDAKKQQILGL